MTAVAVVAGVAFVVGAAGVPVAARVATRCGLTAPVRPDRAHQVPTPYLGGAAIALAVVFAVGLLGGRSSTVGAILGGAAVLAVVGLYDDIRPLPPQPRLIAETLAALAVVATGSTLGIGPPFFDTAVTVAWLVVITNSFNLLDNTDGCAGAIAATTATCLAVAAAISDQPALVGLGAAVAAACAAFLVFNWHPARIFMGDAGSMFLGFVLAALALAVELPTSGPPRLLTVLLFSLVALVDTTLVVISRMRSGRPIHRGNTDHTAHRLQRIGVPVRVVGAVLTGASMVASVTAIMVGTGRVPAGPVLVAACVAAVGAVRWLLTIPGYSEKISAEPAAAAG